MAAARSRLDSVTSLFASNRRLRNFARCSPKLRCYREIAKRPCAPGCPLGRRGRNKFSYWPVCVACAVVLTFRRPLKGLTVVPLRGGDRREELPFERIIPGGCSDSAYRRPHGYRGCL